ncbi:MAG: ATP-dependent DNA helicase RecQ, partial [Ignavibacteriales bacterium]|nr:ATP-dependent DNA helicase RecQ [Ignavibacteriales bacterium]
MSSILVEEAISKKYKITQKKVNSTGAISYSVTNDNPDFAKKVFDSLHVISTNKKSYEDRYLKFDSWEKLGSDYEERFYFETIPNLLGSYFNQLVESQRDISSIIRFATNPQDGADKYLSGSITNFTEQKIDFTIEFPFNIGGKKGIAIEIDGPQHNQDDQKYLDELRDDALQKSNWCDTVRIKTNEFHHLKNKLVPIKELLKDKYFEILENNFNNPLWKTSDGLQAIQYALIPFAIARFQKMLIQSIKTGLLSLKDIVWNIAIIERDVPFAKIAIEDIKTLFNDLIELSGRKVKLPEIDCAIFPSRDFYNSNLSSELNTTDFNKVFDIVFDVSILSRENTKSEPLELKTKNYISCVTSNSVRSERIFETAKLIKYQPLISFELNENGIYDLTKCKCLKNLLQNIFRKYNFRPGQIEIINKAFQLQSVVGLLPTGSGKSLAYQISSILQPGVTLIIDPIKSLMKDQYDGLRRQHIDGAVFINSSIKSAKERELAAEKMSNANVLFTFISPERLQIKAFRDKLIEMHEKNKKYFSYCVVDEVHCVSEWGHDFRTSYLRLGANAKRFCKINSDEIESIPIIGLTATASFDVLSDVQRELELSEDALIRSDSSDRPELIYKIWDFQYTDGNNNEYQERVNLGESKQENLIELISYLEEDFLYHNNVYLAENGRLDYKLNDSRLEKFFNKRGNYKNAGIIFCPHKTWFFGVKSIAAKVKEFFPELELGTFMGASGENEQENLTESFISEENQDKFINNQLDILVATKAFGMGIDKPNIRFIVHINYPNSIESFYQEAGRAGRDGKLGICYILYAGSENEKAILDSFLHNSFKGEKKEKSVIWELLDDITYPTETEISKFEDHFSENLGLNLKFNLWQKNNLSRLYVNKSFNLGYGFINLHNLSINPSNKDFNRDDSLRILQKVKDELFKFNINQNNFTTWLASTESNRTLEGIEKQLEKVNVGDRLSPIMVGFRNDRVKIITDELQKASSNFTERIVHDA